MKILNFDKVKKATKRFLNFLGFSSKKQYTEEKTGIVQLAEDTQVRYRRKKGGQVYYKYICRPLNKRFSPIYRNFNKQKLPGCMIIIGKLVCRIELNPHYKFA